MNPPSTAAAGGATVNGSTGNVSLVAGANITLSTAGSTITVIGGAGAGGGAGTNGAITGGSITVNTSGVSVALPAYLTTAAQVSHSHGNPTLALTNLTGTTASASNGLTLSLSGNAAQTVQPAVGLNTALTANGVSWTVNSSGVSLNVPAFLTTAQSPGAYLTTAAQVSHSHGNPTLALTNLTGTTASASNGFTLSLSAAAPGGGAAPAVYFLEPTWNGHGGSNALLTNITGISRRVLFMPFENIGNASFGEFHWPMSRSTSGSNAFSVFLGIYSFSNSSRLDTVYTTSGVYSNTDSGSVSGLRGFELTFASTSLSPGQYVLGLMFDPVGASTASMNYSLMGAATGNTVNLTQVANGTNTFHVNVNHMWLPFHGRFSVTTASLPASVPSASILAAGNATNIPLPMYWVLGTNYP